MGWVTPTGGGGAPIVPSGTVVSEQSLGQAAANGASAQYSRGDHTHGTMSDPFAGVVGITASFTVSCNIVCPGGTSPVIQSRLLAWTSGVLTNPNVCT